MRFKIFVLIMVLFFVFLLSSCLGIQSSIDIRSDGSGSIDLVYTISNVLESIGKQDGNASMPAIPVSRNDFEKTVSRIDGLSLKSYKSKADEENLIVSVTLDFDHVSSLVDFFDEGDQLVKYTEANGTKELVFVFNETPANLGSYEQELFIKAFEGYRFDFSLKTQGNMEASFIGQNGEILDTVAVRDNSVFYQVPMTDLMLSKEPKILKIVF